MKHFLIALMIWPALISGQQISYPHYNTDSILRIACADSDRIDIEHCKYLRASLNDESQMFPNVEFERVVLLRMKTTNDNNLFFSKRKYFERSIVDDLEGGVELNTAQVNKLLSVVNNPLNYKWSECGTPRAEFEFVFVNVEGEVVRRMVVACDATQIITDLEKRNPRMKFGAIFNGRKPLLDLIYEIDGYGSCQCFEGVGSKAGEEPNFSYEFSNGEAVILCGYGDTAIYMSEFNVFECSSGKSLGYYGALESCRVEAKDDTLKLVEISWMPSLPDWEWVGQPVRQRKIYALGDSIHWSEKAPCFVKRPIPMEQVSAFLEELDQNRGDNDYKTVSYFIGKLQYFALNDNQWARKALFDFENYYGVKTNAATLEHWTEAKETVLWIEEHR